MIYAFAAIIIAIAMSVNSFLHTLANTRTKITKCCELTGSQIVDSTDTDDDQDDDRPTLVPILDNYAESSIY